MKKIFVLALTVIMILAFAAFAMAEATFSGEVDAGYKSYAPNASSAKSESMPYIFGKVNMSGKLAKDLTGTMVIKSNGDPSCGPKATTIANGVATDITNNVNGANGLTNDFQFDEADVTLTKSFGSIKLGYYGWNNNPKDIVDSLRQDTKSNLVASGAFKVADHVTVGVAYAIQPTEDVTGKSKFANAPQLGIDLGYATDSMGVDLMSTQDSNYYTKSGDHAGVTGIQGWYKVGDFKPFVQYESVAKSDTYDKTGANPLAAAVTNEIVGFTYDSANSPIYARVEYDAAKEKKNNDLGNETGIRLGYKLTDGSKIEFQTLTNRAKDNFSYLKYICAF